jgi:4-aminobutyrate aminotransferase
VGTMSLTTSKTIYRSKYQPLMSGVFVAPYPYPLRFGWDDAETTRFCLEELEFLLITQTSPQETAAILIEPVLGEGGYVVPSKRFMQGVREICNRNDILLIADEIQSGFGRTGKWFAHEYFDITPDIMTIAKGLGSGMPISGVISRMDLMKKWIPGSHGGTYGGNAVAAAAAVATVKVIKEEKLLDNTLARGDQLKNGLKELQKTYPEISEIRGLGLMVATEFRSTGNVPDKTTTKAVTKACLERNLLLLTCGPWDNVIRWIPPLVVTEAQIKDALAIFKDSLHEVLKH